MIFFEEVLAMLGIILLSNVINRFIPSIAIPLIQVALGMMLAIFTSFEAFEVSSEFFMLLFLAPLLFNDGMNVNKKALWEARKAISVLSIALVFVTVGLLGSAIHWLIPVMPWAGSFALAAALAPTDPVAVSALSQKVKIPHKMMHTLEGESLINDASGLVSFQFAVAALLTGSFSMAQASISFVLISLGGVLIGVILSFIGMQIIKWLRHLGIENTTSFILFELLLPFGIFLVAEHLHANGILAVVSAGLVYSLSYQKVTPEIAQLHLISKNTWSVFSFSLNGLVFVLLGIQLPHVIHVVWENNNISNYLLIFYILCITTMLLGIRFICFWLFKNFETAEMTKKERFQQSALYTISGVRGTITLVSALSLPVFLSNGDVFLERELLISIAGGVIVTTLLLANFTMSLFAEKREREVKEDNHEQEIEILRGVVMDLQKQVTPDNQKSIRRVVNLYNERIIALNKDGFYGKQQDELKELVLKWQLLDTVKQLYDKEVNLQVGFRHMRRLNRLLYQLTKDDKYHHYMFYGQLIRKKVKHMNLRPVSLSEQRRQRRYLLNSNLNYVTRKLEELEPGEFPQEMISFYLSRYSQLDREAKGQDTSSTDEWIEYAIQIERDSIQHAFELGEMSRNELKVYRENLSAIESTIQFID